MHTVCVPVGQPAAWYRARESKKWHVPMSTLPRAVGLGVFVRVRHRGCRQLIGTFARDEKTHVARATTRHKNDERTQLAQGENTTILVRNHNA